MSDNTNVNANTPPPPPPVNAEAVLTVRPDGLEASVRIKPPENGGADLSYGLLKVFLAKNRILFGLDDDAIKSLGENPVYDSDVVIARGVRSQDGVDARLIYHIETDRQLKPKEKADGSVDFKDLGAIQDIKKGDLLCEKIAVIPGKDGSDVKGVRINCRQARDLSLPEGQNTVASEDKLKLYAALDGHVTVIGGKINVLNTFVVNGNVSVETGNIDFSGNVVVRGDVTQGYTVKAAGDMTVEGVVEAARVIVGGDLVIRGGFLGGDSGVIEVTGNAACRFIEGGQVQVKGNLETTYIMNAMVRCGGTVDLIGKGLIRGGYVSARTSVVANFLGSPKASSANTVIEIGNDPFLHERYEKLQKEAEEQGKNITSLEAMIAPMETSKQNGVLSADKIKQLDKAKTILENLKPAYETVMEAIATLEAQMDSLGRGTVDVRKSAYAGLKIIIGMETLILQVEHERVSFYNTQDGITFVPLSSKT